jgi:predicted nucleotidyltransferase
MFISAPIEGMVPGLRGRVLTVLVRSPRPLGLRELTRRAHSTSPSSVRRVLASLGTDGIVNLALVTASEHLFALNRDHYLSGLLIEADHAKDAALTAITGAARVWLREPRSIVLFGSAARGSDEPGSDLDVLMVWKGEHPPTDHWPVDRRQLCDAVFSLTGNPLNITEMSAIEWNKAVDSADPFVATIARDGVLIAGTAVGTLVRIPRKSVAQRPRPRRATKGQ